MFWEALDSATNVTTDVTKPHVMHKIMKAVMIHVKKKYYIFKHLLWYWRDNIVWMNQWEYWVWQGQMYVRIKQRKVIYGTSWLCVEENKEIKKIKCLKYSRPSDYIEYEYGFRDICVSFFYIVRNCCCNANCDTFILYWDQCAWQCF